MGTVFLLTLFSSPGVPLDVSGADLVQVTFLSPKKRRFVRTASFFTDGRDGKVTYVGVFGDIDVPGRWQLQAKITFDDVVRYAGKQVFRVSANI